MTENTNPNPGCLTKIFSFLKPSPKNSKESLEYLPYRIRDDFLSPAEFSFYKILNTVLDSRYVIQSKVRLADIFFVARPNENLAYLPRIAQRHIDFLVCDALTMKPTLGIELDDASHKSSDRQGRDEFLGQVFAAAKLPLCRVSVKRAYVTREIEELLAPYLKQEISTNSEPQGQVTGKPVEKSPICPKCGIPMIVRTVSQGDHKGKQFYGCQNFPRCREVKPISK